MSEASNPPTGLASFHLTPTTSGRLRADFMGSNSYGPYHPAHGRNLGIALGHPSQLSLDGGATWYYPDQPAAELAAAGLRLHADYRWEILPGTIAVGTWVQLVAMSYQLGSRPRAPRRPGQQLAPFQPPRRQFPIKRRYPRPR